MCQPVNYNPIDNESFLQFIQQKIEQDIYKEYKLSVESDDSSQLKVADGAWKRKVKGFLNNQRGSSIEDQTMMQVIPIPVDVGEVMP